MESLGLKNQPDYQPRYKRKSTKNYRPVVQSKKKVALKKGSELVIKRNKKPLKSGARKNLKCGS